MSKVSREQNKYPHLKKWTTYFNKMGKNYCIEFFGRENFLLINVTWLQRFYMRRRYFGWFSATPRRKFYLEKFLNANSNHPFESKLLSF